MTSKDVGHYGGSVALADYCPYIQVFSKTVIRRFGEEACICRSSLGGATMLSYEEAIACMRRTNQVSSNTTILLFYLKHFFVINGCLFQLDDHPQATKETLLWSPMVQVMIIILQSDGPCKIIIIPP